MEEVSSEYFDDDGLNAEIVWSIADDGYVVGECLYSSASGYTELFYCRRAGKLFLLKALREEYRNDTVAIAALRKEFDLGFRLDIPEVVKTFDLLNIPGKGLALLLEYCPGSSLRRLMDEGFSIEGPTLLTIARSLVEGVDKIHIAGVIHRDIKPSNIVYDSSTGNLRLIDFGCADSFDHALFKGDAGTKLYKSTEFANTPAEDWYALSITLSELAGHCCDRRAVRRVLQDCSEMRKGHRPNFEKNNGRQRTKIITFLLVLLALIVGMVFYLTISHHNKDAILVESSVGTDSIVSASSQHPSDSVFVVPSLGEAKEKGALASLPGNAESSETAANIGENSESNQRRSGIDKNDREVFRASQNHILPDEDISEVNFCAVNGKYESLVEEVRNAAQKVWLAAEQRKMHVYKSSKNGERFSQAERDSIDMLVYDEETNCEAILKEMQPLPPGTDMERLRRLIRQRYMTLFPRRVWHEGRRRQKRS